MENASLRQGGAAPAESSDEGAAGPQFAELTGAYWLESGDEDPGEGRTEDGAEAWERGG